MSSLASPLNSPLLFDPVAEAFPDTAFSSVVEHKFNAGSDAATNFAMTLYIHRATGTNSDDDVYVGQNCLADFSDIRFYTPDGLRCDHYIESIASGVATIWVNVPYMSKSGAVIRLCCGNGFQSANISDSSIIPYISDFTKGYSDWVLTDSPATSFGIDGSTPPYLRLYRYTSTSGNYYSVARKYFTLYGTYSFIFTYSFAGYQPVQWGSCGFHIYTADTVGMIVQKYIGHGDPAGWYYLSGTTSRLNFLSSGAYQIYMVAATISPYTSNSIHAYNYIRDIKVIKSMTTAPTHGFWS